MFLKEISVKRLVFCKTIAHEINSVSKCYPINGNINSDKITCAWFVLMFSAFV